VISLEASVRIERPIEDVFAFVSDPTLFPSWNSAVRTVSPTSAATGAPGSIYSMARQLPGGRAENELEVYARADPHEFGVRTTSGPTPFAHRYRFAADGADTVVHLDAAVELPVIAALFGPLAARGVKRGVDTNFAALKRALEGRPCRSAT
jgi:ligand-binding SRPBCC domain-containing protein